MVDKKMEEKGHADTGEDVSQKYEKENFVCPVCKRPLHEDNLVDIKSVVEDNLYFVGGVHIVGRTCLHCDFEHQFDKEEVTLNEPHKLVAVVDAEFDGSGECVHFEIKEVLPG